MKRILTFFICTCIVCCFINFAFAAELTPSQGTVLMEQTIGQTSSEGNVPTSSVAYPMIVLRNGGIVRYSAKKI